MLNSINGIILQAITYKETDQILIAYTPIGMLKLSFKGALSKKRGGGSLTAPLQLVEFIYLKRDHEIHTCREITVEHPFTALRLQLDFLESGGEMAKALLSTQALEDKSPLLYNLFVYYLEHISKVLDPYLLAASFKLKLLRHDGLLAIKPFCCCCQAPLKEIGVFEGQPFCPQHTPENAIYFDEMDTLLLLECMYTKSMSNLMVLDATPLFLAKIRHLFLTMTEK